MAGTESNRTHADGEGDGGMDGLGAGPVEPSWRGSVDVPVNQLRDPTIFEEVGRVYLLYSVVGERGIALARVEISQ